MKENKEKTVFCSTVDGVIVPQKITNLTFRISVYGIAMKDEKLLVLEEYDGVSIPGGKVELGETPEESLIREFKEEIALSIEVLNILHVANAFFILPDTGSPVHTIGLYYSVKIDGSDNSLFREEHEDFVMGDALWMNYSEIKGTKLITPADKDSFLSIFSMNSPSLNR